MKFNVLRQHQGDKFYNAGDEREANESDVAHLVKSGVLEPIKAKAEPKPKNKAIQSSPKNKAG